MSDPRVTFANGRVAHVSLRGMCAAPRYAEATPKTVARPVLGLYATPEEVDLQRQMLLGDTFEVLEEVGSRVFGRASATGYVGYVDAAGLQEARAATHRVTARTTLGFAAPDIKAPGPIALSLGSLLRIEEQEAGFLRADNGRFFPARHLAEIGAAETDPVAVAERLLGAPYLWGGNSAFGLDCSGLVQIALAACGVPCPGDSDQQCAALGRDLAAGTDLRRGDLLFWPGHVGWVSAPETLLHANAFHMAVVAEPLQDALARIGAPKTIKRL